MVNLNTLKKIAQICGSAKPEINSTLCVKNKSPRVKCGYCATTCPHKAVKFKKPSHNDRVEQNCAHCKIEITDDCTDCGFCTAVCPAGALTNASATFTALKPPLPETLLIHCKNCSAEFQNHTDTIEVFCPGRIDENDILAIVLAGTRNFNVYIGKCENCSYWRSIGIFSEKAFFAASIAKQFGIEVRTIFDTEFKNPQGQDNAKPAGQAPLKNMDRRNFLGELKNKAFNTTARLAAEFLKEKGALKIQKDNRKRKRFLDILAVFAARYARPGVDKVVFERKTNLDFIGFPEASDTCTGCDVCVKLCPTGALQCQYAGNDKSLHLDARLCIACGICETFCRYKAITVKKEGAIEFVNLNCGKPQTQKLISLFNIKCPDCGMEFYATAKTAKCIFC